MTETKLRDRIAELGKSIFDRGMTAGSSGNNLYIVLTQAVFSYPCQSFFSCKQSEIISAQPFLLSI